LQLLKKITCCHGAVSYFFFLAGAAFLAGARFFDAAAAAASAAAFSAAPATTSLTVNLKSLADSPKAGFAFTAIRFGFTNRSDSSKARIKLDMRALAS